MEKKNLTFVLTVRPDSPLELQDFFSNFTIIHDYNSFEFYLKYYISRNVGQICRQAGRLLWHAFEQKKQQDNPATRIYNKKEDQNQYQDRKAISDGES